MSITIKITAKQKAILIQAVHKMRNEAYILLNDIRMDKNNRLYHPGSYEIYNMEAAELDSLLSIVLEAKE